MIIGILSFFLIAALSAIILKVYEQRTEKVDPETLEWESAKLDTEISYNERQIARLHLDIFYGVPEKDSDVFDLIMEKFASRRKGCPHHWEIPEVAWTRIRSIKEANGAYLIPVPRYQAEEYALVGLPVTVAPFVSKFDLVMDECQ